MYMYVYIYIYTYIHTYALPQGGGRAHASVYTLRVSSSPLPVSLVKAYMPSFVDVASFLYVPLVAPRLRCLRHRIRACDQRGWSTKNNKMDNINKK